MPCHMSHAFPDMYMYIVQVLLKCGVHMQMAGLTGTCRVVLEILVRFPTLLGISYSDTVLFWGGGRGTFA